MAKPFGFAAVAVAVAALCLIGVVHCDDRLTVEGPVYCDTCRVDFPTPLSYDLKGATVRVECRNRTTSAVTLNLEGVTDDRGWYSIPVEGDHEDELCEVGLVSSGDPKCTELMQGAVHNARVTLTNKNGMSQTARYASALGYATPESHPNCSKVLLEMGVLPPEFY